MSIDQWKMTSAHLLTALIIGQFLSGFPVVSMCVMRSIVFCSPHSDTNASRSRSRKYCSSTHCARRKFAAAKDVCDFAADVQIVFTHVAALLHDVKPRLERCECVASRRVAGLCAHWRSVPNLGEFQHEQPGIGELVIAAHYNLIGVGEKTKGTCFGRTRRDLRHPDGLQHLLEKRQRIRIRHLHRG